MEQKLILSERPLEDRFLPDACRVDYGIVNQEELLVMLFGYSDSLYTLDKYINPVFKELLVVGVDEEPAFISDDKFKMSVGDIFCHLANGAPGKIRVCVMTMAVQEDGRVLMLDIPTNIGDDLDAPEMEII